MKNVIKILVLSIIGTVFSVIIGAIDAMMLAFALISKGLRVAGLWVMERIGGIEESHDELKTLIWSTVNYAGEYLIDELYPTDEDEP